jgi:glycosyltransferase involved in cell wall biosynthesis
LFGNALDANMVARAIARSEPAIVRTAFVSTYPPRRCGIATFTSDLSRVIKDREIVALHPPEQAAPYPMEVHHRIRRDEPSDYLRVARSLRGCVDIVSVQHEYGIWGGEDGESVLDFVGALDVPAIATLHTILRKPTPRQKAILVDLISMVRATVVMSRSAATLLTTAYGVNPSKVDVVPHGVLDLPMVGSDTIKPGLGLAGRDVILSFGLLGPGKGYELVIDALPAVVAKHPKVQYVIVGATHPDLIRREGEAYRTALTDRVKKLKLGDHVQFVDRFVGRVELTRWLESADVFVTPYPNLEQIVSGTMSYAMGAGRAIVSTPYAYAAELLADGRGVLVPPASPDKFADALNRLLADPSRRAAMGQRAYEHTRNMIWPEVGTQYRHLLERIVAERSVPVMAPRLAAVNA